MAVRVSQILPQSQPVHPVNESRMSPSSTICDNRSDSPSITSPTHSETRDADAEKGSRPSGNASASRASVDHHQPSRSGPSEEEKGKDEWLVKWDGPDDPENPQNWTFRKKMGMTILVMSMCINVYVPIIFGNFTVS